MGRSSGTTNCTVYVQDAAQTFPGFDAPIVSKRIAAGHTEIGQVNVVVGTLGSRYINLGSLTCK